MFLWEDRSGRFDFQFKIKCTTLIVIDANESARTDDASKDEPWMLMNETENGRYPKRRVGVGAGFRNGT